MRKHSLSSTGLSLSQAQSISNLCNQRALEITSQLSGTNNASKSLNYGGNTYIETQGKPIPEMVVQFLQEKGTLHACQAFLMENIKAKDKLIQDKKQERFKTYLVRPEYPELKDVNPIPTVTEEWGWEQLTTSELNEFYEAEALAAHVGQFIHKGGVLDNLRKELPNIKTLEWITIKDGEKTPMVVTVHHTSEQLLGYHEQLAAIHRKSEQRVNYFKAKVKNLVTEENARIANLNADMYSEAQEYNNVILDEYQTKLKAYEGAYNKEQQAFEAKRQEDIKSLAALRIQVDARFQATIDSFLKQLE